MSLAPGFFLPDEVKRRRAEIRADIRAGRIRALEERLACMATTVDPIATECAEIIRSEKGDAWARAKLSREGFANYSGGPFYGID